MVEIHDNDKRLFLKHGLTYCRFAKTHPPRLFQETLILKYYGESHIECKYSPSCLPSRA